MKDTIIYIGDFDLSNCNVQSLLVKNNAIIFRDLGFDVIYIGVNYKKEPSSVVVEQKNVDKNLYFELPYSLSVKGLFYFNKIVKVIKNLLNDLKKEKSIKYVISYQAPTFSGILKSIAKWCIQNNAKYIVNCADIPTFDQQKAVRRVVMTANWQKMHSINRHMASGVIAATNYISNFYKNKNTIVIPPLFDCSTFNGDCCVGDVPVFVYAGTPFKLRNGSILTKGMKDRLDFIIDCFQKLEEKNISFIFKVFGISKEEYIEGVPRHKSFLDTSKNIKFFGRISHDLMVSEIKKSDFTINYRDENIMTLAGFSTKIVESVSLGTPVIINNISDNFLYLKKGVSGHQITNSLDENILMLSKLCLLSIPERQKLKQDTYNLKTFDINNYKEEMEAFLCKVL